MKRTKSPSTSIIGTDHPNMKQWLYKNQAAHAEYESLNADLKKVMNQFLAPYWSSRDDLCKIFERPDEPVVIVRLARMVIDRDIELMNGINSMRPRIFFPEPTIVKPGCNPYDLSLTNDPDIQSRIDQVVSANLHNIGKEVYDIAIAEHLKKLKLPFSLKNDSIIFHFSNELNFSAAELREMSMDQLYSL
ncbi:MAG: hypothetical protein FJ135_15230 [Deltaproteobacteria bacterium]|nr:hypothetical protein [Deltaproteobacteria bacterium]